MSFGDDADAFDSVDGRHPDLVTEINMVPLIDVMLVLLVIFLVTIPVLTHNVNIQLPKASSQPSIASTDVVVSLDEKGQLHWNKTPINNNELTEKLTQLHKVSTMSSSAIHIRADRNTPYEKVAELMSKATRLGISKIGFVTEPDAMSG